MNKRIYDKIMSGNSDANIKFQELCAILGCFGFELRVKGDHYIYSRYDIPEIINIQPQKNKAKAYQVKQIRMIFKKYGI